MADVKPDWLTSEDRFLQGPSKYAFAPGEIPYIGKARCRSLFITDSPSRHETSLLKARLQITVVGRLHSQGEKQHIADPVTRIFDSEPIIIRSKPNGLVRQLSEKSCE
jgi:hypothetical protein